MERLEIRLGDSEAQCWRATAAVSGLSLSAWIRQTCNVFALDDETFAMLRAEAERKRHA